MTIAMSLEAGNRPAMQVIGEALGARVLRRLGDCSGDEMTAVQWQHDPADVHMEGMAQNVLAFHVGAPMAVTKSADGRRVVKRPVRGAATLMRSDRASSWHLPDACQVLHLYMGNNAFEAIADANGLRGDGLPDEFFGLEDRWLQHYFQLLCSELELCGAGGPDADDGTLFLSQSEPLLVRHLLRLSAARGGPAAALDKRVSPLRPFLLRRIQECVAQRLDDTLSVGDLADQVHLSVDHFLKAFHAATGRTPYQYVLAQRIERAQALLRDTTLPVADVAIRVGFRNASNFCSRFHKHVGLTPSAYRQRV